MLLPKGIVLWKIKSIFWIPQKFNCPFDTQDIHAGFISLPPGCIFGDLFQQTEI
jgi:hypothetical protein